MAPASCSGVASTEAPSTTSTGRELDLAADRRVEQLDRQPLALGHPFLLAAGADDRVHELGRLPEAG